MDMEISCESTVKNSLQPREALVCNRLKLLLSNMVLNIARQTETSDQGGSYTVITTTSKPVPWSRLMKSTRR